MLVDHVRHRRADGAGPATVANDLTWIGVVLRAAKSVKELPVNPLVMDTERRCRHAVSHLTHCLGRTKPVPLSGLVSTDALGIGPRVGRLAEFGFSGRGRLFVGPWNRMGSGSIAALMGALPP
jgi:hypothetical protein